MAWQSARGGGGGVVTGQIDTCIISHRISEITLVNSVGYSILIDGSRHLRVLLPSMTNESCHMHSCLIAQIRTLKSLKHQLIRDKTLT